MIRANTEKVKFWESIMSQVYLDEIPLKLLDLMTGNKNIERISSIKFFRYSMLLMALSIGCEGFWTRNDFLHEVRWYKEHPICKINFINFTFRKLV